MRQGVVLGAALQADGQLVAIVRQDNADTAFEILYVRNRQGVTGSPRAALDARPVSRNQQPTHLVL